MTSRFVEVPASAIRDKLTAAGFRLLPVARGEEIYAREHDKDNRYTIKVYSSIRQGEIRQRDADAIRVVALLIVPGGKTYPIFKSARVYRTGTVEGVLDRMIERAREAYATCSEHRRKRQIWGDTRHPLPETVVRLMVGVGDIARFVRDHGAIPLDPGHGAVAVGVNNELKKELGNILFSTVRWIDDLGLDVLECLDLAIEAQERFAKSGRPR